MSVENLAALADARLKLSADSSVGFVDWYTKTCRANDVPILNRRHFDPTEVPEILPSLVILDVTNPRDPIYRLAGTKYVSFLGTDPTGKRYLEYVPDSRFEEVTEAYLHCSAYQCGMITHTVAVNGRGHERTMEMVNLPFWKDTDGGAALHLLALFNPRGNSSWRTDDKSFSQFVRVDYRAFIDLGKGTPDAFQGVNLR